MRDITKQEAIHFVLSADIVYVDDERVSVGYCELSGMMTLTHVVMDESDIWYGASYDFVLSDLYTYSIEENAIVCMYNEESIDKLGVVRNITTTITLFSEVPYCPHCPEV